MASINSLRKGKGINLDWVAPLIADPPQCNSTTMHSRLVRQDRNVCINRTVYLTDYQQGLTAKIQTINSYLQQQ